MAIQKKQIPQQQQQQKVGPSRPTSNQPDREDYNEATENPNAAVFEALAGMKGFSAPDPGTYEAVLHSIKINPLNQKGQSVQAEFVLAEFDDEGNLHGTRFSRFFKIFEADGRTPNASGGFLIQMMAKLGYSKTNVGQEAFDQINETQPAVSLSIKANTNPDFPPNANVLMRLGEDNDNIIALREWIEGNPF